ncbi:uncharacterized protein H6S33_004432 [Morchella sextelata]|uniref:uncharacterized protein n=1 Tax=Morchella sextelata TaxID=1174677 RepID=UPI001D048A01|nr:uncharacterized protein H6S33_004432 [Morchella sextelata]KAH0605975.1 hypothetical protein H6S33_004432 [Morchella sextelata]
MPFKKHNISYTLYERSPDPSSSSPPQRTGYQIRLGAPALDAFRRCLTPNVKATICARFGRGSASAPILYGKSMGVFVDLTRLPSYPKSAPVNRVVLRDALAEEVDVVYGKAFVRYEVVSGENGGKERIKVFFEDWTEDVGDLLVAADGSGSKINVQAGLCNIITLTKIQSFLIKGPLTPETFTLLPPEIKRAPVAVPSGRNLLFASCYLPTPAADTTTSHNYDPTMASLMLSYVTPTSNLPTNFDTLTTAEISTFLKSLYADADPRLNVIISAIPHTDIYTFNPRTSRQPAANWRHDVATPDAPERGHPRVWFLGDAVHPMLPGRGMGGNQAMHDAGKMLEVLVAMLEGREEIDDEVARAAGERYEKEMMNRAFGWVKASRHGLGKDGELGALGFNGWGGWILTWIIWGVVSVVAGAGWVLGLVGWRVGEVLEEFE